MVSTSEIKNGLCIKHNNKLMQIIEFQHVKPGKGPAFVRTKMKGIEDGRVLDHTFPSGHKIEVVRIENGLISIYIKREMAIILCILRILNKYF